MAGTTEGHYKVERKVAIPVLDEDDDLDWTEEYRDVCGLCVPKYGIYRPWPWHDPKKLPWPG